MKVTIFNDSDMANLGKALADATLALRHKDFLLYEAQQKIQQLEKELQKLKGEIKKPLEPKSQEES